MATYRVPDVYVERRPRVREVPAARTDVVGFIGFEPRVRPAAGNFRVDIAAFQIDLDGRRIRIPEAFGFDLLNGSAVEPIANDKSMVFALVAIARPSKIEVAIVRGAAAAMGAAIAPSDDDIATHISTSDPWIRLVDVVATKQVGVTSLAIRPRLGPVRCDDWNDYIAKLGVPADDGLLLGTAARFFFANGGSRAWISTVTRPSLDDRKGLADALDELVGVEGASEDHATGLERLLLIAEVSVIDVPDLYARRLVLSQEPDFVLPRDEEAEFIRCANVFGSVRVATVTRSSVDPIFTTAQVTATQGRMLERCLDERWRVLLLFSPPLERDPADARWRTPSDAAIKTWAGELALIGDDLERSCAALYAPWVQAQDGVDAPVLELPPTAFVAGVIARRDLARGPQIAPANETMRGVVGLTDAISDDRFAGLYDEPPFINLLRAFPGEGVRVWGARTLSTDRWLRWVPVRRCLSAIQRRMRAALDPIVFEPNTPALWLQVTHLALAALIPLFESGALRGETPEEAFYVRCGPSNNPPDAIQNGLLVCEVGVAVAAPAEFVVFRLGRREGVVEVLE